MIVSSPSVGTVACALLDSHDVVLSAHINTDNISGPLSIPVSKWEFIIYSAPRSL